MKRLIVIITVFVLLLSGCTLKENKLKNSKKGVLLTGVWISFSEVNKMLSSEDGFETEVDRAVQNCSELGMQNVYIHIRAYCDSLFESDYFPLLEEAKSYSGDAFELMLEKFHKAGIRVHAWINPYRVLTSSSDIEKLDKESPAYKWLKDDDDSNDINVCISNGIYLNPSSPEVQKLIIDGVRETVKKYAVDGIHFDDYFYPTTSADFDAESYNEYKSSTENPLELGDWRRANVNSLISGCYSAIKYINPEIEFSISPAASVEDNYDNLYADVKEWIKDGYIDTVIPQLYFGFEYPINEFRFEVLLNRWEKIAAQNNNVSLIIGLASYKIGTSTEPDNIEWQRDADILSREARLCYESEVAEGCVFFSYSSLFSNEELNLAQRNNFKMYYESISKIE